jgi:hypothetical protein
MDQTFSYYPPPYASGRAKIVRRRPFFHRLILESYGKDIGPVLWEWNTLHVQFFHLFWLILDKPRSQCLELWTASNSDDLQRKMLRAVAYDHRKTTKNKIEKRVAREIIWAIDQTNKFAASRNVATHVPMALLRDAGNGKLYPMADALFVRPTSAVRHLFLTMGQRWKIIAEDLHVLGQYVLCLGVPWAAVAGGQEPPPSPRKPRLRSLPILQEMNALAERITSPPKRRRRRGASKRK